jgi:DNA-directed RNA polymerase specialized sigma24 family protein
MPTAAKERPPSDFIRGVGPYHSRVPLSMVESHMASDFIPPADPDDPAVERDAREIAREQVVRFMQQWFKLSPRRAAIVQLRICGLTWREIGRRLGGITPQAGEKQCRAAMRDLPGLRAYFAPMWNRKGHRNADG